MRFTNLLNDYEQKKINGAVEGLKVNLNSETRVAESILWTYRAARQLAARCGDVAF